MVETSPATPLSVSSDVLQRIVDFCARRGHPKEALCQKAGIPPEYLLRKSVRVPLGEVERLCLCALDLVGDHALGLHLAEDIKSVWRLVRGPLTCLAKGVGGVSEGEPTRGV